jgi:hypothetical protein
MLYFQNNNDPATGVGLQSNYGTVSMDGGLDLGNYTINANTGRFLNLQVSETNDPSNTMYHVMIYGGQLYTQLVNSGDGRWYLYQSNCDLANNPVKNVQYVSFYGAGTLDCDLQDNLTYNSDIVITSENINQYISQETWNGTAESDLNMSNFSVVGAKTIELNGGSECVLSVDSTDNLLYNNQLVVSRKGDILQSEHRDFVEYIPNQPMPMIGNPIAGNVNESINLADACYDNTPFRQSYSFTFQITQTDPIPLDSNLYIIVGFCDNGNEANSTVREDFVKIDGRLMTFANNTYSCQVSFSYPNPINGITYLQTLGNILAEFQNNPDMTAYYYIKAYGNVDGSPANLNVFTGSVDVLTGEYTNDYYVSVNENDLATCLAPVNGQNNNLCLPLVYAVSDVSQNNGVNSLMSITPPSQTGDNGMGFSITASVVSAWYCVKYFAMIYSNNGEMEIANGSESILHMWNPNNVLLSPTFLIDSSNNIVIQNEIATSVQHSINTASVKVKLQIVNY